MDFSQTATLHYARAYFNATLLGDIFTRMGLPPDSLEFLTRGAKFQRPPLLTTLRNLPGLLRLLGQENSVPTQFAQADTQDFAPALARWKEQPVSQLADQAITKRIEEILALLKQATYFNILAPLSLALRQALLKVDLATLDSSRNPEVRALEEIKQMAVQLRSHLPELGLKSPLNPDLETPNNSASLFAALSEHPEGHIVFDQLDRFLERYGYLSEVATDIAVPTWRESPQPVRELLTQHFLNPNPPAEQISPSETPPAAEQHQSPPPAKPTWKSKQVQSRLDLKGRVAEVYDRLLANLRGCFVELESRWLSTGQLESQGDIFFLTWSNICAQLSAPIPANELRLKIHLEKVRWQSQKEHRVPYLIYGQAAATLPTNAAALPVSTGTLTGIGASVGQIEGTVHVLETLSGEISNIDASTILVVPYTDAGWSPLLARIGGLIAEVGGQLSHGAIIAREYGIPAVMNVSDATQKLTTGQRVRIDGQRGTVEVL
jgi:pyruvate,water dikinase